MKLIKFILFAFLFSLILVLSPYQNSCGQTSGNMKDRFYTGVFNFYYLAYPHIYSSGPDRYKQLSFNMLQCYGHHEDENGQGQYIDGGFYDLLSAINNIA